MNEIATYEIYNLFTSTWLTYIQALNHQQVQGTIWYLFKDTVELFRPIRVMIDYPNKNWYRCKFGFHNVKSNYARKAPSYTYNTGEIERAIIVYQMLSISMLSLINHW